MGISKLIQSLNGLTEAHNRLLDLSKTKTEVLINGDMDELQKVLAKERKEIRLIEQAEQKRVNITEEFIRTKGLSIEQASITSILEQLTNEDDQSALEKATVALIRVITELKAKEETNRGLIAQSMQFVQFSLDLLQPSLKQMNYGQSQPKSRQNRSVFDSKA